MKKVLNVFVFVFCCLSAGAQPSQSSIIEGLANWKSTVFTILDQ